MPPRKTASEAKEELASSSSSPAASAPTSFAKDCGRTQNTLDALMSAVDMKTAKYDRYFVPHATIAGVDCCRICGRRIDQHKSEVVVVTVADPKILLATQAAAAAKTAALTVTRASNDNQETTERETAKTKQPKKAAAAAAAASLASASSEAPVSAADSRDKKKAKKEDEPAPAVTPTRRLPKACSGCKVAASDEVRLFLDETAGGKRPKAYCVNCWVKEGACGVCTNVNFTTPHGVATHFDGKKHAAVLALIKERTADAAAATPTDEDAAPRPGAKKDDDASKEGAVSEKKSPAAAAAPTTITAAARRLPKACSGCKVAASDEVRLFLDETAGGKRPKAYCADCWVKEGACGVCTNVNFSTPHFVATHFDGKKHATVLALTQKQSGDAEKASPDEKQPSAATADTTDRGKKRANDRAEKKAIASAGKENGAAASDNLPSAAPSKCFGCKRSEGPLFPDKSNDGGHSFCERCWLKRGSCTICENANFASADAAVKHLQGKSHAKNVEHHLKSTTTAEPEAKAKATDGAASSGPISPAAKKKQDKEKA